MKNDLIEKLSYYIGVSVFAVFFIYSGIISLGKREAEYSSENRIHSVWDNWVFFIGALLGLLLAFFVMRWIVQPVYLLAKKAVKFENGEISKHKFKSYWWGSLILTLLMSIFIITVPLLIPQYVVLSRSYKLLKIS